MKVRCAWCFKELEIKPEAFRSVDGEDELEFIIISCRYCKRTIRVWRDGETERVLSILDNEITTD